LLDSSIETNLVNQAQASGGDVEADPAVLLDPVELLGEEVHVEDTLCAALRVRHVVTVHRFLSGDLTNLRHFDLSFFNFQELLLPNRAQRYGFISESPNLSCKNFTLQLSESHFSAFRATFGAL